MTTIRAGFEKFRAHALIKPCSPVEVAMQSFQSMTMGKLELLRRRTEITCPFSDYLTVRGVAWWTLKAIKSDQVGDTRCSILGAIWLCTGIGRDLATMALGEDHTR